MADATKVSTGKPKVGGAISVAPAGTAVPTSATAELAADFVSIGYCSEDGLENDNSRSSSDIKAWGGDVVDSIQDEKTDEFKTTLIEALNENTLKLVHGDTNVTGTLATGITVKVNSLDLEEHAYVIDMIMKGGAAKRITIPHGKVTEVGSVKYSDSEAIGYEVTIKAFPDTTGNTHYEYIQEKA